MKKTEGFLFVAFCLVCAKVVAVCCWGCWETGVLVGLLFVIAGGPQDWVRKSRGFVAGGLGFALLGKPAVAPGCCESWGDCVRGEKISRIKGLTQRR